jgi:hypothetical protein
MERREAEHHPGPEAHPAGFGGQPAGHPGYAAPHPAAQQQQRRKK